MKTQHDQRWLSPSELAEHLGLGMTRTYELLRSEIPSYRIGRVIRVQKNDIETWLETQKTTPKN